VPQDHPAGREEALSKLWSMIKGIKVAMMTTWDGQQMHARPMHGYQEAFNGKLYFYTRLDSGKTQEIGQYDKLNLAYADPDNNSYVSIAGSGHVSRDRSLIEKYWNKHVSAWFPKGLDDPELAIIEVDAESAQYWDSTYSSMRYFWEVARANMTGREPNLGENARINL
jgi:general stress protein 26